MEKNNQKIPLCAAYIDKEDIKAVKEVMNSGWLAHGPKNKEFEENFAKYVGVKRSVTLNSCTSALFLAVLAKNLKGEIILPSFTFTASANAIVTAGAKPVFCDIDPKTFNIDTNKIKKIITNKTVGIMPVHYAGQPANMTEIMEIAEKHNLAVIEDSAECIGGTWKNKKGGSFSTGCFSFYPTKNITTGEGGMLTTNDDEFADKVAALAAHGISSRTFEREKKEKPWFRAATYPGFNFRLSNILAAFGNSQLKKIDKLNKLRRKHAAYLTKELSNAQGIIPPFEHKEAFHVYQMYVIQLEGLKRDRFVSLLREKGIMASVHFDPPVHLQPAYSNYANIHLPATEKAYKSIVTLPMFPALTQENLDYMIETIKNIIQKCK